MIKPSIQTQIFIQKSFKKTFHKTSFQADCQFPLFIPLIQTFISSRYLNEKSWTHLKLKKERKFPSLVLKYLMKYQNVRDFSNTSRNWRVEDLHLYINQKVHCYLVHASLCNCSNSTLLPLSWPTYCPLSRTMIMLATWTRSRWQVSLFLYARGKGNVNRTGQGTAKDVITVCHDYLL